MRFVALILLAGLTACGHRRLAIPVSSITSDDPAVRSAAFHEVRQRAERDANLQADDRFAGARLEPLVARARADDKLALALIRLLERENAYVRLHARNLPPDYGDGYYAYLGNTVAMLRDKRSVKALVGAMNLGYEPIHALVQMGELAVPDLIVTMQSGPDESGAALALKMIVADREKLRISDAAMTTITIALMNVVASKGDYILRKNAIDALLPLSSNDIRSIMREVAAKEPVAEGSEMVRVAARNWLLKHPVSGTAPSPVPRSRLESPDPAVRAAAFYEIRDEPGSSFIGRARARDSLAVALIELLERENDYIRRHTDSLPPHYRGGYYASVVEAVAALDDQRAVRALLRAMSIGYEPLNSLIRIGEGAVPDLLVAVRRGPEAADAATALGYIFDRRDMLALREPTTRAIVDTLLSVIRERGDYQVRTNAIKALMSAQNELIRAVMQNVSDNEPVAEGSSAVVAAAREWLRKYP